VDERLPCMRCGIRVLSDHLQRVATAGGEYRFCILCAKDFWEWLSCRSLHTEAEPVSREIKGFSVALCLICRCELDRWLKPLYL